MLATLTWISIKTRKLLSNFELYFFFDTSVQLDYAVVRSWKIDGSHHFLKQKKEHLILQETKPPA
jgi:hypothetical protein